MSDHIALFERWFMKATKAQRVHEDTVNEYDMVSIAGEARSQGVTLSKELQKGLTRENVPHIAPRGPSGPSGMGGGGNSSSGLSPNHIMKPKPPTNKSSDE